MSRQAGRIVLVVVLGGLCVLGPAAVFLSSVRAVAGSGPSTLISQQEAVTDARRQLPHDGAGFAVVKTELEPSSEHFVFTDAHGGGIGEDGVRECLVIPPIPPLPFITPCRAYPVWVVELSSPACDVTIAVNARSGRFGGGGMSAAGAGDPGCQIVPEDPAPNLFQPFWQ